MLAGECKLVKMCIITQKMEHWDGLPLIRCGFVGGMVKK